MRRFKNFVLVVLTVAVSGAFTQSVWTTQKSGTKAWLFSAASGLTNTRTQLVVVGNAGTILTSRTGTTWTTRTSGTTQALNAVAWASNQFVAVGDFGVILTSPNGTTWTTRLNGTTEGLNSIIWTGPSTGSGTGQWVTVGSDGFVLTSPNGTTWTTQKSSTKNDLISVAWASSAGSGTGQLVAVGDSGVIETSPDGVTWTAQTSGTKNVLHAVAWTGSQWVAVGAEGVVLTSPDARIWTAQTSGTTNNFRGVAWTGPSTGSTGSPQAGSGTGQLIAVGQSGIVMTSLDGRNWTEKKSGTENHLIAVIRTTASTGGAARLVAVGDSGTIVTSPLDVVAIQSEKPVLHTFSVNGDVLQFVLPGRTHVIISLFDLRGNLKHKWMDENLEPGPHELALIGLKQYHSSQDEILDFQSNGMHEAVRLKRN